MTDATAAAAPPRRPAAWTALVPGLRELVQGAPAAGALRFGLAAFLIAVAALSGGRMLGTLREGRLDDWIALLTWLAAVIALWGSELAPEMRRAVARRLRRGPGGERVWAEFHRNRLAAAGLYLMIFVYLAVLLTPYLAPYDPAAQGDILATRYLPPSAEHLMGTDRFGRDIFSRLLYGARISLSIGFIAMGIAVTFGTAVGAVAGYFGRITDTVLMRFVDMLISFPRLVLVVAVIGLFRPSIFLVIAVLGLTLWPSVARIVRGEVVAIREREFVQAARALGLGDARIISRHVIPNVLAPVIVTATLGIGNTILLEAGLSFLGFGVQPPTPSWGRMIAAGRDSLVDAWWVATFPGLAIVITVVAFNLIGDGLRDALDPRLADR